MPRHVLAACAMALLLIPAPPAAGQFREFLELFQPKQKPKRHVHPPKPIPLPPKKQAAIPEKPAGPPVAKEGGAETTAPVPLPPVDPRGQGEEPAKPPADTGRKSTSTPAATSEDIQVETTAPVPLPPVDPRGQGDEPAKPPADAGQQRASAATGTSEDVVEDRWSDSEIVDALSQCVARLGPIVAEVKPLEPIKAGRCGTAAPVRLLRLGKDPGVEISPAATLNCDMLLALNTWIETSVQPAARRILGSPVVRLRNVSSYSCRNRNSAASGPLSEHAFANALDISSFVTADGRSVALLKDWGLTEREREATRRAAEAAEAARQAVEAARQAAIEEREKAKEKSPKETPGKDAKNASEKPKMLPETEPVPLPTLRQQARVPTATSSDAAEPPEPESTLERAFLRRVHKEACGVFGTVLGPEANNAHKDHFHLDLAARRHSAYCE